MKTIVAPLLALSVSLSLSVSACNDSGSSSSDPAPAPDTGTSGEGEAKGQGESDTGSEGTGGGETAATGGDVSGGTRPPEENPLGEENPPEKPAAFALSKDDYTYRKMQFDCGNYRQPFPAGTAESVLTQEYETMSATVTKDKALLQTVITDAAETCTYRAYFEVAKNFKDIGFLESQALKADGTQGCATARASIDAIYSAKRQTFQYDVPLIRWVALLVPAEFTKQNICPAGNLRVIFGA